MITKRFVLGSLLSCLLITPAAAQESKEVVYLNAMYKNGLYPARYFTLIDQCVAKGYAEIPILSAANAYKQAVQTVAPAHDPQRPKDLSDELIIQQKLKAIEDAPKLDKIRKTFKPTKGLCEKMRQNYEFMCKIYKVE